jgi:hypothetical protein
MRVAALMPAIGLIAALLAPSKRQLLDSERESS